MNKWLLYGIGFSLLPIWRVANVQGGMNLFEYISIMISNNTPYEHIQYDKAIDEAGYAYDQSKKA